MKIAIGNDHAAVEMKQEIRTYLEEKGYEVINFGTDTHESCNYPEYGEAVGRAVAEGKADCGVLICGTGVGISLAANKVPGVLAAVCSEPTRQDSQRSIITQISSHLVQGLSEWRQQKVS